MNNKNNLKNNYKTTYEDFEINKILDLSDQDIPSNLFIYNLNSKSKCFCKVPLKIWDFQPKTNDDFGLYNNQKIEDKQILLCVGDSVNIFFTIGAYIYMRDNSFNVEKIGKGFITYNKKRDCAILNVEF